MQWEDSAKARFFYRCREHQRAQLQAAVDHAGPLEGKAVLDVGCGYGDLLFYLPMCRYFGIDTNELAVETARASWPGRRFGVTDEVEPADVVISVATLQMTVGPLASLKAWMGAARERLVVVTCKPEKLPAAVQDEPWWDGIERETFPSGDDFYTSVVYSVR